MILPPGDYSHEIDIKDSPPPPCLRGSWERRSIAARIAPWGFRGAGHQGFVREWDILLAQAMKDPEKRERIVADMWQRCYTTREIAEAIDVSRSEVDRLSQNVSEQFLGQTTGYPADYTPALYNVWKRQTKSAGVEHFGNSEPEWVDRLIYRYTKPGDIVVDPFAGGG